MANANKAVLAGRVISGLASLMLLGSAVMKLLGRPEVVEEMARLGIPESVILPLGIVELLCVIAYAVPATSITGAILLTGYLGGAICAHVRVADPFIVPAVIGVLIWLGLYLREPRLKSLIPLAKS